jgi:hypothetical protein
VARPRQRQPKALREKGSNNTIRFAERHRRRDGDDFDPQRFVPYVVMHEFEGLLFSDCDALARGVGNRSLSHALHEIREEFDSPEEINDSPQTAPSKRIKLLLPNYDKPLFGNVAALEIGLAKIREQCPHFGQWLTTLESLA